MTISNQGRIHCAASESWMTIPNVLNGTECGRIKSPDVSLVGRRIVHDEHFGTICYVGPLPGSTGQWLGVDWDNPSRGRHDGSYQGYKYFPTKTATSGSFVRPDKVSLGTSLEEALVYRYVLCAECQLSASLNFSTTSTTSNDPRKTSTFQRTDSPGCLAAYFDSGSEHLEYSGTMTESEQPLRIELFTTPAYNRDQAQHRLCGPQGAEAALKSLQIATFTLVPVYRALRGPPSPEKASLWPHPGGTLGDYLPNLTELDLGGCLFSRWKEVAEITIQLPWLKSLNLSSNHLRLPLIHDSPGVDAEMADELGFRIRYDLDTDLADENIFTQAFPNVCKLVLVRSVFLDWPGLIRIMKWMPSLKSLAVAYNQLGNLPANLDDDIVSAFRRLIELDLTSTDINELDHLFSVIGPSRVLDTLLLSQNPIGSFPELPVPSESIPLRDPFTPSTWFQGLASLNLRNTEFTDWYPIKQLLRLHKLEQLSFSDCPVMKDLTIETARQELIARLPHVSFINRIEVCPDERRGAELDYLKRYGGVWRSTGGAPAEDGPEDTITMSPEFAQDHPVFAKLCKKLGIPDHGESKLITRTLKEGLTNISFVLQVRDKNDPSATDEASATPKWVNSKEFTRRIPGRMTVAHLRMMVRRLFKIAPKLSFDLIAQGERHRKINTELVLDADTREVGFYCLEDGDNVFVRVHT